METLPKNPVQEVFGEFWSFFPLYRHFAVVASKAYPPEKHIEKVSILNLKLSKAVKSVAIFL